MIQGTYWPITSNVRRFQQIWQKWGAGHDVLCTKKIFSKYLLFAATPTHFKLNLNPILIYISNLTLQILKDKGLFIILVLSSHGISCRDTRWKEAYFHVHGYSFSSLFLIKVIPGCVLPKGGLSPLALSGRTSLDIPPDKPLISKKSAVNLRFPFLRVIHGRHLRWIYFLAEVFKIKLLANGKVGNEESRIIFSF